MAAANASARGQRVAILASPLHQLTGFYLAVDCRSTSCDGERSLLRIGVARLCPILLRSLLDGLIGLLGRHEPIVDAGSRNVRGIPN